MCDSVIATCLLGFADAFWVGIVCKQKTSVFEDNVVCIFLLGVHAPDRKTECLDKYLETVDRDSVFIERFLCSNAFITAVPVH